MEDATAEISPFPSISGEAGRDRQASPAKGLSRRRAACPIGKALGAGEAPRVGACAGVELRPII